MMSKKTQTILIHFLIYGTAITTSWILFNLFDSYSFFLKLFIANLFGCFIIYFNCIIFDSFSINDPNWTIQSSVYSFYYLIESKNYQFSTILVFILVNIWSFRLTFNLYSTAVHGIKDEDWRFSNLRPKWKPKVVYFVFGFFGILFLPFVLTYFGCVPLYYIFRSKEICGIGQTLGILVIISGILIEAISDYQLSNEFEMAKKEKRMRFMNKGLWSQARHPNYFGEILFWFGLFVASIDSSVTDYLRLASFLFGPVGIFLMIYFMSMPLMEERQLQNKPDLYKKYMSDVPFKILPINFLFSKSKKNKKQ
ncbi:hypothetical protein BpHYR1_026823 [Brachionus plicatilis]|uniref:Uncharacterized protein n=1 Tax=Brachionus plicatilis TaxID=10195 RepID=A0A3M7QC01_BRAPC|nr:hypothetical protein BpHYR1_026823 [Brachionus plicatilis]